MQQLGERVGVVVVADPAVAEHLRVLLLVARVDEDLPLLVR